jgi:hypothetical protein
VSYPGACPPGVPDHVICHLRVGKTAVVAYSAQLSEAGKGDLNLAVAGLPECIPDLAVPGASPQSFTVTGGTGAYVGASGGGTLTRVTGPPSGLGVPGEDTWTGAIVVPGLEFDLIAPTIGGTRSKTVRAPRKAKRVRVTYQVTATDDVDGRVPVSCRPASGSRFKIGRTIVTCSATDKSGNTATARFTVTVRRSG